jgi:hypothetical protein
LGVQDPMPAWAHDAAPHYVKTNDPLVDQLTRRLSSAPVITEWCGRPDWRRYYEKGLHDVVAFRVSMTSIINFPDRDSGAQMKPELCALWSRANAFAGYRYSMEGVDGSGSAAGTVAFLDAKWTNYGSATATEKWSAGYRLIDRSGAVVRTLPPRSTSRPFAASNLRPVALTHPFRPR